MAQLETPVSASLAAFAIARQGDGLTLLNAAPAPDAMHPALLDATDVLIVNEIEGRALSGRSQASAIGETLLGAVGKAVVVTLGAKGAMLFEHRRPPHHQAAFAVNVVDATGAGDAFAGAFAARWVATHDLRAALAWGVAAGALACAARGAAVSFADAAEIASLAQG